MSVATSWSVEVKLGDASQPFIRMGYSNETDAVASANYILAHGLVLIDRGVKRFIPVHRIHEVVLAPPAEASP